MSNKKKCPVCNSCLIPIYRGNELFWHCSIPCKSYYKALPQGKLELTTIEEALGRNIKSMRKSNARANSTK